MPSKTLQQKAGENERAEELRCLRLDVERQALELSEAREQQAATGSILRAIAASPTDVEPVLNTVVESATRLCGASFGQIFKWHGTYLRWAAAYGLTPEFLKAQREQVYKPGRELLVSRTALNMAVTIIDDALVDPDYALKEHARLGNYRTMLGVPLLQSGKLIGVLALVHHRVEPFTGRQIEMVTTFADQAVIAIENTRVFEELQTRNRELAEALEQQTATGTILRAIAASPTDVEPVLNTVVESAARLCGAYDFAILLADGDALVERAHYGPIPIDFARWPIGRDWVTGRAYVDRKPIHVHDLLEEADTFPLGRDTAKRHGYRTMLAAPLMREDKAIGVLILRRREVRPFSQKQVDLLVLFAHQAAIAIANARLFEELETRNHELTEALEQQTATGAILRTIAASPTDVAPVLNAVAESAARLCDAYDVVIALAEDDTLAMRAHHGPIPIGIPRWPIERDWVTGRAYVDREPVHVHDLMQEEKQFPAAHALAERVGYRTNLAVPLLREDKAIGVIGLRRQEVRPFSQKQIDLLVLFADQAAIAIENTRLFEEVQIRNRELTEALEQQTATGAILRAIAASPTDVEPVLNAVAESAARLCEAYDVVILLEEGNMLVPRAHNGPIPLNFVQWPIGRDWVAGRAYADRKPIHVHDIMAERDEFPAGHALAERGGGRTVLAVPLLREDKAIGVIAIRRGEMRPFSQKQIDLLALFAHQAAIAIENTRLFKELETSNRELTEALEQQTATGTILRAIAASPADLQPVLGIVAESAAKLCDAHDAAILLPEDDGLRVRAHHGPIPIDFEKWPISRDLVTGRAFVDRKPVHVRDLTQEGDEFPIGIGMAKRFGHRTMLAVPLLREDKAIGALIIRRMEVRPFSQRQIDLLVLFADQAVIAIENARLFEELQTRNGELTEAIERQTATAEVLKAISRAAFDLPAVLRTLVASAARLCGASFGGIMLHEGGVLRGGAIFAGTPEDEADMQNRIIPVDGSRISGRVVLSGHMEQIPDIRADHEYELGLPRALIEHSCAAGYSVAAQRRRRGRVLPWPPGAW